MSGSQGAPFNGVITIANMTELLNAVRDLVRASANIYTALQTTALLTPGGNNTFTGANTFSGANSFTGVQSFTKPVQLPNYTVGALPAVVLGNVGSIAYATNGRNTGEGGGAGTGCAVQVQNKSGTATWCAIYSGVAVTA